MEDVVDCGIVSNDDLVCIDTLLLIVYLPNFMTNVIEHGRGVVAMSISCFVSTLISLLMYV